MLSYKPERNTRVAMTVEIILFIFLITLAVLWAFDFGPKVVTQGLVFSVAAGIIYMAMRYMLYQYTYTVSNDTFQVSRVAGRIPAVLVSVEITKDDLFIRTLGRKQLKESGVVRIENACANLAPHERLYAYITTVNGRKTAILVETDELYALAVNERINMKKISDDAEKNKETED